MPIRRTKVSILDYNLITLSLFQSHITTHCVLSNFEYHHDWIYIKVDSQFESHPFAGHLLRIICSLNNNPFTVSSEYGYVCMRVVCLQDCMFYEIALATKPVHRLIMFVYC